MTRARSLALWLVATIVLIAAGLVPSGAKAHAGHPHGGPHRASVTASALPATPLAVTLAPATKSVVAATVEASAQAGLGRACDGACCRAPGAHCCTGTALAADPQAILPPRDPADRALPRALAARTDVVPEALPEPPRPFA